METNTKWQNFPSICFLDTIKNLSAIKRGRKYVNCRIKNTRKCRKWSAQKFMGEDLQPPIVMYTFHFSSKTYDHDFVTKLRGMGNWFYVLKKKIVTNQRKKERVSFSFNGCGFFSRDHTSTQRKRIVIARLQWASPLWFTYTFTSHFWHSFVECGRRCVPLCA